MGIGASKEKFEFESKDLIGCGAGGHVYKRVNNDKTVVAVKVVAKSRLVQHGINIEAECSALKLSHPNILHLLSVSEDKNSYFLVTKYCAGGDLDAYIRSKKSPLTNQVARKFLIDIVHAELFLCDNGLIHRDIKPSNLLLTAKSDDATIVMGDFGTAKLLEPNRMAQTTVGTMFFCAPEVLSEAYDNKVDMWSIGVTLYYILTTKLPFDSANEYKYLQAASKGVIVVPENRSEISDELWDIIVKLLKFYPSERMSIQQLARTLGILPEDKADVPLAAPTTLPPTPPPICPDSAVKALKPAPPSSSNKQKDAWFVQVLAAIADELNQADRKLEALCLYIFAAAMCKQQLDRASYSASSVKRRIILHIMTCSMGKIPSLQAGVADYTVLPSPGAALQGYFDQKDTSIASSSDKDKMYAALREALKAGRLG